MRKQNLDQASIDYPLNLANMMEMFTTEAQILEVDLKNDENILVFYYFI